MTTLSALTVGASAAPNEWTTPGTSPMEVIASANDTSYGEIANNATATFDQGYELNAVPADLGNVDDLSVRIRYFWAATPNGLTTWDTLAVRIMSGATVLAAADAGGTFKTLASSITTTTPTNTTLSAFAYVNTGAAKSLWDAAVVQIRQTSSKTKGGDTTGRRVSAFEVSGNYTIGASTSTASGTPTDVRDTASGTATATGGAPSLWDFVKVTESYVSGDANQTSCSITQATHGSTAGNLLVGAVSIDKDSGTITPPTGWTQINAVMPTTSLGVSTWVGWRVATGDSNDDFAMSWATAVGNSDTHIGEWYTQGITPVLEDDGYVWPDTTSTGHTVDLGAAAAPGRLIAWACIDSDKLSFSYTGVTEHPNQTSTHLSGFGQSVGAFGSTTVAASDPRSVTSLWQAADENYLVTMQFVESVAAATFEDATLTSITSVSTDWVANRPSTYAEGDLFVAFLVQNDVQNVANGSATGAMSSSGWTELLPGTDRSEGGDVSVFAYWKVAGASEAATYTWGTLVAGCVGSVTIFRFSGQGATPIDGVTWSGGGALGTSVALSGITTSQVDTVLLAAVAADLSASETAFWSDPIVSGWTAIISGSAGEGGSFTYAGAAYTTQTAAGASGNKTATTQGTSENLAGYLIGIAPGPAGGAPPGGSGTPTDQRDTASGTATSEPLSTASGTPTDQRDTASGTATSEPLSTASGTPTDQRDTASGAATCAVAASGTPTDQRDTASGTATSEPLSTASGTPTDQRDTASGTATSEPLSTASGTPTDQRDTAIGTAQATSLSTSASGSPTDQRDTASGAATSESLSVSASGSPTDQRDTASGTATYTVAASGSPTDQRDTASGTATYTVAASGSPTDQRDTASGTAASEPLSTASGSPIDVRDTASGTAASEPLSTASGSPIDVRDTASGTAASEPLSTASGSPADVRDAASGTATCTFTATASGAPTDSRDIVSGTATFAFTATASGAPTDSRDTASGTATYDPGTATASGAATDVRDIVAGTGIRWAIGSGSPTDQTDTAEGYQTLPVFGSGGGGGGDFAIGTPGRYRDLLELDEAENDDEEVLEILGHVLPQLWMAYLRQTQSNR